MYITEDLVIKVVSGIFYRSKFQNVRHLMILKERDGYFYPQQTKKGENHANQISRGIKDIPHL